MTTTRYYDSDMTGAPQWDPNDNTQLITVLRACLVDGFDTRAPAGWTEPFTSGNKAVFRNSIEAGGTGCYVRVDGTADASGFYRNAHIQAFSSMSDIDTGMDGTYLVRFARRPWGLWEGPFGSLATYKWAMAADELTFYLWVWGSDDAVPCVLLGAGDFFSFMTTDSFRYFVLGGDQTDDDQDHQPPSAFSTLAPYQPGADWERGFSIPASWDGLTKPIAPSLLKLSGWDGTHFGVGYDLPTTPPANIATEIALPAVITEPNANRGILRGVYCPLQQIFGPGAGTPQPNEVAATEIVGPGSVCRRVGSMYNYAYPEYYDVGLWIECALEWPHSGEPA